MELFECARCHLGSWAAIVSARQRLLPALWALCGVQCSRNGTTASQRLVGSDVRVVRAGLRFSNHS